MKLMKKKRKKKCTRDRRTLVPVTLAGKFSSHSLSLLWLPFKITTAKWKREERKRT